MELNKKAKVLFEDENEILRERLRSLPSVIQNPDFTTAEDAETYKEEVRRLMLELDIYFKKVGKLAHQLAERNSKIFGKEIERKFLVKENYKKFAFNKKVIEQKYLETGKNEVRIRKIEGNNTTYLLTKKEETKNPLVRKEMEKEITAEDYYKMSKEAISEIRKTRYYFSHREGRIFTIDDFHEEDLFLLEIELNHERELVYFPEWLEMIREVTDDPSFRNQNLATEI